MAPSDADLSNIDRCIPGDVRAKARRDDCWKQAFGEVDRSRETPTLSGYHYLLGGAEDAGETN